MTLDDKLAEGVASHDGDGTGVRGGESNGVDSGGVAVRSHGDGTESGIADTDAIGSTDNTGTASAILEGDTNGDGRVDIDDRRLPLIARIYGVLILFSGFVSAAELALTAVRAVWDALTGRVAVDLLDLTMILSCLQVVVGIATSTILVVFGVLLLMNRRKHAARWAYVLIPLTFAEGMLSLALAGIGWNLLTPVVQLVILTTLSIVLDPNLLDERRQSYAQWQAKQYAVYQSAREDGMLGRDPSGKGYIELEFFNIFWLFVIGSVFGLTVETVSHLVRFGELQDRAGLLWGPFSPIYGCGAVILTACLNRLWRSHPMLIFCASAVIGGAFEYFVSWFLEIAFGITAWDYTGQWLSIDGRTSGKYMIFWGFLGMIWIKLLLPRILWLINLIPWKVRYSLTAVMFVFMLIDVVMTLMAFDCWYGRVAGEVPDSPVTMFFAEYFDNDYMQQRFQTMSIDPSSSGRI